MRKYLPSTRAVKPLHPRRARGPGVASSSAAFPVPLSLVVPVYNGADRLPDALADLAEFLHQSHVLVELVLVDDGSDAATAALLEEFVRRESCARLLRNATNRGKGYSVARGLREARGRYRIFTDADLAYPVEEVLELLPVLEAGNDIVVACRVLPESRYLMSPAFFRYLFTRHVMSRFFNFLVRVLLIPGILDSQAGLKGLSAEAVDDVVPRLTIDGFAFDVELLFVALRRGLSIAQAPVFFRYDSEPSTVSFATDVLRMVRDLVRIRWNDVRGRYR
jgi:glycosyltransferase involved in cell wall biosynthesis